MVQLAVALAPAVQEMPQPAQSLLVLSWDSHPVPSRSESQFPHPPTHWSPTHPPLEQLPPVAVSPTLADAIRTPRPVRYREVLASLRACDGRAIAVTEDEIRSAHHRLARAGLLVEPTSAVAAAAALRYRRTPEGDGTRVAVILTGMGLKALAGARPV